MANKLPTTSYGRLVQKLRKTPMTRRQITEFLLKQVGKEYAPGINHDHYNSSLYGTSSRRGLLEQYGQRLSDGRWTVIPGTSVNGPFNQVR